MWLRSGNGMRPQLPGFWSKLLMFAFDSVAPQPSRIVTCSPKRCLKRCQTSIPMPEPMMRRSVWFFSSGTGGTFTR